MEKRLSNAKMKNDRGSIVCKWKLEGGHLSQ